MCLFFFGKSGFACLFVVFRSPIADELLSFGRDFCNYGNNQLFKVETYAKNPSLLSACFFGVSFTRGHCVRLLLHLSLPGSQNHTHTHTRDRGLGHKMRIVYPTASKTSTPRKKTAQNNTNFPTMFRTSLSAINRIPMQPNHFSMLGRFFSM